MQKTGKRLREAQPRWITAWFIADAVVALAPPLYWAFDGDRTEVLGVPASVLYFVAVATCITASIVAAYVAESRSAEIG
jgi:putative effector of murein hydrolase